MTDFSLKKLKKIYGRWLLSCMNFIIKLNLATRKTFLFTCPFLGYKQVCVGMSCKVKVVITIVEFLTVTIFLWQIFVRGIGTFLASLSTVLLSDILALPI